MTFGLSTHTANQRLTTSLRLLLQEDASRLRAEQAKDTPEIVSKALTFPHTLISLACAALFLLAYGLGVDTSGYSVALVGVVGPWSLLVSASLLLGLACVNVCLVLRRAHRLRWEVHGRAVDVLLEFERACLMSVPLPAASAGLAAMLTGLEGGGRMATVGHKTNTLGGGGQGAAAAAFALRPTGLSTETWGREAAGAASLHHHQHGLGAMVVEGVVCGYNAAAWPALEFATAERDSKLTHELTHAVPVYRDGHWVRLPVSLVVRGDIIALMHKESPPGADRKSVV